MRIGNNKGLTRNLQQDAGFDGQCRTFSSEKSSTVGNATLSLFPSKKPRPCPSLSSRLLQNPGLTLTELMISVTVMGLLISVGGAFLIGGIKFYRLTMAKGEIQRDARRVIDLLSRNLRQGFSTTVTVSRYNTSQPPCSLIQFSHIDGNDYRFYQMNDKLYMGLRVTGTTNWNDRQLADNLRTLFFAYPRIDDAGIISVSMCFEKSTYQGASKTLQLSVEKVRIMN